MKVYWANEGEVNESGEFEAVIDMEIKDKNPQRFFGKTHKEVADKLLQAQANATEKIIRDAAAHKTPTPIPAQPESRPQPLSADDRLEVANTVTEPEKAPEAITRVVEAAVGATMEEIGESVKERRERNAGAIAAEAAKEFIAANPDYVVTPHNSVTMMNYLRTNGLDPTKVDNYTYAWEKLKAANLVNVKDEEEGEGEAPESLAAPAAEGRETAGEFPAKPAPTMRPRTVASTGVRRGDSTGVPSGITRREKYTLEQIEAMPTNEYEDKLRHEPGFGALVDRLNKPAAAAR